MSFTPFDPLKSLEKHLGEFDFNSRVPFYNDSSDYTTNAPTYYDDLARKNKLIKHLALRIWNYDEELKKRFEAWDKNLEEFDDEVLRLLKEWMADGTFDEIINEVLFGKLNEKIDFNDSKLPFVSIYDYPRKSGETHDDKRIQRAIDDYPDGLILQFYNEEYITSRPIMIHSNVTLQGNDQTKSIIKNVAGTHVVTTKDTDERYYYCRFNDIKLDGVSDQGQTGLNIPNVTHASSNNLMVMNTDTGIYFSGNISDGSIGGCYYNHFFNTIVSNCNLGIEFDTYANENAFYGGKVMLCDVGIIFGANACSFFGLASEGNFKNHIIFKNINNSLYGVRMEGFGDATGVLSELRPEWNGYANYIYSAHYQGLKTEIKEVYGQIFNIGDRGIKIPLRITDPALTSKRNMDSPFPMINMTSGGGTGETYRSETKTKGASHFKGYAGDELVAEINGYGEFISYQPQRGITLTSEDGTHWALRINNFGELLLRKRDDL